MIGAVPVLLALAFAVTALLYASVGFGGGSTYSALLALSGLDYRLLPLVSLACNIVVVTGGSIRFARARGLSERVINFRHALKNTLVPVITIAGLQLGSVVAFAIVTETVFQWPGVGSLFITSVQVVDVPVMAAYLMFIAFVFVVINLVVDILYYAVDPRLRVDQPRQGQ